MLGPLTALRVRNHEVNHPTLLTTLQETQERTRKRIKEDLKESNNAYAEYADSTLPKLKSRYLKKFAEAEASLSSSPQLSLALPPLRN